MISSTRCSNVSRLDSKASLRTWRNKEKRSWQDIKSQLTTYWMTLKPHSSVVAQHIWSEWVAETWFGNSNVPLTNPNTNTFLPCSLMNGENTLQGAQRGRSKSSHRGRKKQTDTDIWDSLTHPPWLSLVPLACKWSIFSAAHIVLWLVWWAT